MTARHYPVPLRRTPARLGGVLCCLFLAACGSAGPTRQPGIVHEGYGPATAIGRQSSQVLMRAIGLVGTPYRYGGNTPAGGFDCSGLVGFVFLDAVGLRLPRSTGALLAMDAPRVDRARLIPGDLVLFNPGGGKASHIGIYVGEERFVHAPSSGGTVRLDALSSPYWRGAYAGARRVLR